MLDIPLDDANEPKEEPNTMLIQLQQRWQLLLDRSTSHIVPRWVVFGFIMLSYLVRVYLLNGWFIVTYGLGIFILNLFIGKAYFIRLVVGRRGSERDKINSSL
jgi:hypothetical protein